jgi:hypothetical protein
MLAELVGIEVPNSDVSTRPAWAVQMFFLGYVTHSWYFHGDIPADENVTYNHSCGRAHPGLCETQDAAIYDDVLALSQLMHRHHTQRNQFLEVRAIGGGRDRVIMLFLAFCRFRFLRYKLDSLQGPAT